ncbi:MAG: DUF4296 domain-containing protein [Lutibacter sp.]|nr:DUF4296 domain-containing protein [Lutibacter sp.]MBP9600021.1 DUF4296 domain-containing protein [Lutibacter sp.]
MKKHFIIALLSFLVISCTSNTILKKPDDLIPRDKMVNLLTDLLLANSADNIRNTQDKRNVQYFPLVFEKYQVDSAQFRASNYYYTSRIDDYDKIMKEVETRFQTLIDTYQKEQRETDSLKRLETDSIRRIQNGGVIKPTVE